MPRPLRLDFDGAWHHVMNRGIDHQETFRDDDDRLLFLELVGRASARFGLEIHAYCLMPNHFHLLVRSPATQLSRSLQFLGQVYTQRFNRRHVRDGALFRGRFHSILVDSDSYLDAAARYIHLNPVGQKSSSIAVLDAFKWSSLAAYEGRNSAPRWLYQQEVLGRFPSAGAYSDFVRRGSVDAPTDLFYTAPFEQHAVLGDSRFTARLDKIAGGRANGIMPGIAIDQRAPIQPADIDAAVLRIAGARPRELTENIPGRHNAVRSVALQLAYHNTPSSLGELAARYGFVSAHSAGTAVKRSSSSARIDLLVLRSKVVADLGLAS